MADGGCRAIQPEGSLTLSALHINMGVVWTIGERSCVIGHGKESPWGWTRKVLSMCRLYRGIDYEGRISGMDREGKVQDNGQ